MPGYTIVTTNGVLMHYGVMGMKWGQRRFQNPDGSLTTAGQQHYRSGSVIGNVGRFMFNGNMGQRLGVRLNRGYRADKKDIKATYKQKLKQKGIDKKVLKRDYKQTLRDARAQAAQNLYGGSKESNYKTQNEGFGKALAKNIVFGGYGAVNYNRLRTNKTKKQGRIVSAAGGLAARAGNIATGSGLSKADYVVSRPSNYKALAKRKTKSALSSAKKYYKSL